MSGFIWIIIIGTSIWVYFDAKKIGARRGLTPGMFDLNPLSWSIICLLLWIIGFPAYIVQRQKIIDVVASQTNPSVTRSTIKQSGLNTFSKIVAVGWTFFCGIVFISMIFSLGDVAPTSGNEYETAGFALGATLGFGMWFFVWVVITIPATILYFVTRKSGEVVIVERGEQNTGRTKNCPFCAEIIKEEAVFCRHCKKDLPQAASTPLKLTTPQLPEKTPPKKNWIERGQEYIKAGEFKEAVTAFTNALNELPSGDGYYLRAAAYSKIKDREKMLADLNAAADLGNEKAKATLSRLNGSQS